MTTEPKRTLEEIERSIDDGGFAVRSALREAHALGLAEGRAAQSRLLDLACAWDREAARHGAMTATGEDMAARDAYDECAEMLRNALRSLLPEPPTTEDKGRAVLAPCVTCAHFRPVSFYVGECDRHHRPQAKTATCPAHAPASSPEGR